MERYWQQDIIKAVVSVSKDRCFFLNFITALQHPGVLTSMPKLYFTSIQVVL